MNKTIHLHVYYHVISHFINNAWCYSKMFFNYLGDKSKHQVCSGITMKCRMMLSDGTAFTTSGNLIDVHSDWMPVLWGVYLQSMEQFTPQVSSWFYYSSCYKTTAALFDRACYRPDRSVCKWLSKLHSQIGLLWWRFECFLNSTKQSIAKSDGNAISLSPPTHRAM